MTPRSSFDENGVVSLWLGSFPSEEFLDKYVTLYSDEDGELIPPPFMLDFALLEWEEDFREIEYFMVPQREIKALLNGCSNYEEIVVQFEQLLGSVLDEPVNAIILLYEYSYPRLVCNVNYEDVKVTFAGVARYKD